ncbi:hypothetical protein I3842_11G015900 [Carya illinoinensis]|uniref:Uncharacterized protein n=1 Tax=Carya illinoinensis TaxID=32201 RepID=A0A922IYJ9_CARIL|nr:hypothetical protein I3842_11G015900 [Carya illinoinensis]
MALRPVEEFSTTSGIPVAGFAVAVSIIAFLTGLGVALWARSAWSWSVPIVWRFLDAILEAPFHDEDCVLAISLSLSLGKSEAWLPRSKRSSYGDFVRIIVGFDTSCFSNLSLETHIQF